MNDLIVIRGGGDIATGVIQKLHRSGFKILVLETEKPLSIRRNVSLSQCVYEGKAIVENMTSILIQDLNKIDESFNKKMIPFFIDKRADSIKNLKPICLIDSIIAKKNLGTFKSMAPITIALGPGFEAGLDVDVVIETMRGHDLGRLIFNGFAKKNTGIPGEIEGKGKERVIHAPINGVTKHVKKIGDIVKKNETIMLIDGTEVKATIDGLLRGLIMENIYVDHGLKIGDIDPRTNVNFNTISDKARNLGGAVLEAYLYLKNKLEE